MNAGTYDGASLIRASGMQILVVNLNYRVGPHGFLASDEVRKDGSLNNGLKDQRQALRWIKDHIRKVVGFVPKRNGFMLTWPSLAVIPTTSFLVDPAQALLPLPFSSEHTAAETMASSTPQ